MARLPLTNRLSSYRGNHNGAKDEISSSSRSTSPNPKTLWPPGTSGSLMLRVYVIKAKDLAAKDKGNTSDPYLVLHLGDARDSTISIPKNLNPEWNEVIDLPIAGLQSMLLEVVCWDKDRFGKDYMGEFDITLEDLFTNGDAAAEPKWYKLQSRKQGKKKSVVTGEVLLSFALVDPANASASAQQLRQRLMPIIASSGVESEAETTDFEQLEGIDSLDSDLDLDDTEYDEKSDTDADEISGEQVPDKDQKGEATEKRKKRLKLKKLKKKVKQHAYEFTGSSDLAGVLFLEINKITDLPPERNVTRTSFDVDPFVVTSLGKKTYKTKVVRHNLNPVFDEKLVFQVLRHEQKYSLQFSVVDRDKLSGNDFIGTALFPIESISQLAPQTDPETGLYAVSEPAAFTQASSEGKKSRFRLPLSRSSSSTGLSKLSSKASTSSPSGGQTTPLTTTSSASTPKLQPGASPIVLPTRSTPALQSKSSFTNPSSAVEGNQTLEAAAAGQDHSTALEKLERASREDPDLRYFGVPLTLKNRERWEDKHKPILHIRAKYMPYRALRQQFWRALLRQYDAEDSGFISKVELTTMLDSLGSTLRESTINRFFEAHHGDDTTVERRLSHDAVVICLEDLLEALDRQRRASATDPLPAERKSSLTPPEPKGLGLTLSAPSVEGSEVLPHPHHGPAGEEGEHINANDLADDGGEERVVEIRECPMCHQPRMNKRSDADIITHIATCASQDWRQVNNIVMAGFVTSSQAQRKWYSKVVTKIGYGGYKLGANSANILVQDRITGQINEEKMSVYVRLGIRLLYKGLKSREMEKKRIRKLLRSLSIKQGRKYDDATSVAEIQSFINFHRLDMSEVLLPTEEFKSFNEFFYRKLKPEVRPCSAPDRRVIVTSPADCRSVVFNTLEEAQKIWVKGREFTVARLLGDAYPQDVKRYDGGSLGIFRLAPQDYHRFHVPVDGVMDEPKAIAGEYYTVNPMAIRSALDVYGENIRVIVPIDSEHHGRVTVVCVGAMMVGSTIITRKAGEQVSRAEELGYFKFGGSTLLLLFEPGRMVFDEDLVSNANSALETLIRVGMSIGRAVGHSAHAADLPKTAGEVTQADKNEAQRRIEGSVGGHYGSLSLGGKIM